jgi:hypothetical protein
VTGDGITLTVTTPTRLNALSVDFADDANVADVLVDLAFLFNGGQLERDDAIKVRLGNRQAATFQNLSALNADQLYAAVTLSDGTYGYLAFVTPKGGLDAQQGVIDSIIASFDSSGTLINTGSSECSVSTDGADTAQLRVGPGPNRGAISFLPANTEVTVTGRIELDDGSVWYQLDKAEAAPNGTAAAELWVAAESVTATGGCSSVGDTAAPPIIQSAPPAPQSPPSDTGSAPADTGSAPADTGAGSGLLPGLGRWTLTYNATTNASCVGYQNVPIPTTEILDRITYTYQVTSASGNSFTYGGDVFTRTPGTNTFTGLFSFEDGESLQAWFTVNSSTSISGQATLNFVLDDTQCSATLLFISSRG